MWMNLQSSDLNGGVQTVGGTAFRYRPVIGWGQQPAGWDFVDVVGVATDSQDRVYAFNRGEHPVVVFDHNGTNLQSWDKGQFERPHGIWIAPDDNLYLIDDYRHCVRKYTLDGQLILALNEDGQPSGTGVVNFNFRTIQQPAGPLFPDKSGDRDGWADVRDRRLRQLSCASIQRRRNSDSIVG
jgi:DNA-binding beta-propeller fold protein YncE